MSNQVSKSSASQSQPVSPDSLKARLQSNPEDGESWLALALLLAHSKPTRELRQAITRSIELLPDNYQAWLLAGLELQQRQGSASALQWLQHIVQQKPALAAPRLAVAQLKAATGDPAAESSYLSIIASFPEDARACLFYAEYLQNSGRLSAAGDYLERALGIQPGMAENWISLAKIRLAEHRLDAAVKASTRALELNPQALEARMTRAEVYRQAAQWQPAKSDYQQLLKTMPDNPFVLVGLGACLAGESQFEHAQDVFHKAIRIKPDLIEARLNLALVQALLGSGQQVLFELEQLMEQGAMSPAMQGTTRICHAMLLEHQRLQENLDACLQTADLPVLQTELNRAPELLLQTDSRMIDRLYGLAEACQQVQWPGLSRSLKPSQNDSRFSHQAAFAEACLLSRTEKHAAGIAALWAKTQQDPASKSLLPAGLQPLLDTWQAIMERNAQHTWLRGNSAGEAWLRYWHSRLFRTSPQIFPGQFKFAPNSIGLHQTIAPEYLVRTLRLLLDEIHPSIPAGPGRACFMLVAIAWIHAFVDGNGRLARFLFAGELEAAGMEPILLMTQDRKAMTDCQDHAQYRNDFGPFFGLLQQAQASTRELLQAVDRELHPG